MGYQKLGLAPGTVLTAEHIKHIEAGLEEALSRIPREVISTSLTYKKGILRVHLHGLDEAISADGLVLKVHYTSHRRNGRRKWSPLDTIGGLGFSSVAKTRKDEDREYVNNPRPRWMGNGGYLQDKFPITATAISRKYIDINLTTWLLDGLRDIESGHVIFRKVPLPESVIIGWLVGSPGGGRLKSTNGKQKTYFGANSEFAFAIHDSNGKQLGSWQNTVKIGGQGKVEVDGENYPNGIVLDADPYCINRSSLYVKVI